MQPAPPPLAYTIANNAFDTGHFTLDKDGRQRVNVPPDGILTDEIYFFIVGDGPSQYPIVPSFQDWEFPHGRIPDPWSRATPVEFSPAVHRCAITNFSTCVEDAHLVPEEEAVWCARNGMNMYGEDLGDINGTVNLLPLRSDIHRCFDNRWLAIVPKAAGTEVASSPSPQYVTHILSTGAAKYWPTYHNTLVQYLKADCRPYVFARFAWTVLLRVKPFINSCDSRHIVRLHVSSDAEGTRMERKAEFLSGAELRKCGYGGGGSKVGSAADDDDSLTESDNGSDTSVDKDFWDDMMYDWEARGKRNETDPDMMPEDNHTRLSPT